MNRFFHQVTTDNRSVVILTNISLLQQYFNEAYELQFNNNPLPEEWYVNRYKYITTFTDIDWRAIATHYSNKDATMYKLANMIDNDLTVILDYYSNHPSFPFINYYRLLNNISSIWKYYEETYKDAENDEDISELTECMLFMNKIG